MGVERPSTFLLMRLRLRLTKRGYHIVEALKDWVYCWVVMSLLRIASRDSMKLIALRTQVLVYIGLVWV